MPSKVLASPPPKTRQVSLRGLASAEYLVVLGAYLVIVVVMNHRVLLAGGAGQRYLWEDFLEYNYPVRSLAAAWLARGVLALWNPFFFAGMPLLGDVAVGSLYPPNLLLAAFVNDGVLSFRALEWNLF